MTSLRKVSCEGLAAVNAFRAEEPGPLQVTDERRRMAKEAVDRALEIDPDLPQARLELGLYHYRCHRDYGQALVEMSAAAESLPNDPLLPTL